MEYKTYDKFNHYSVLLKESINGLKIKSNGIYIDGTLGLGGHSEQIAKKLTNGKLFCFDLDPKAIEISKNRLKEYKDIITYINDDYKNMLKHIKSYNIEEIDGIMLDLGISSMQIDDSDRGFSYMKEGLLDMRMHKEGMSAYDVVNNYSLAELTKIFREYGEEQYATKIALKIIEKRKIDRIKTTTELSSIICESYPRNHKSGHPAKKVFQAIRIEVNNELRGLYDFLCDILLALKKGGRASIITFHSLEDRIVKNAINFLAKDCICDKSIPICVCGKKREIIPVNKKPIIASEEEIRENKRSLSAKLRIVERI